MVTMLVIVIVVALVGVLSVAASRPDTFRVERSIIVAAPQETVQALIEDFHRWVDWSPWEKLDPALQRQYSGQPLGLGAIYEWNGNNKVGQGRMEIIEALPGKVLIQLDFFRPFKASNKAEFQLEPATGGTQVSWAMYGPSPFISKLMSLVASMDKMVGKDFERGLAQMKAAAEGR
ncbi:SRPBCC family protein [Chitinimonas sp.]|uniref:SRPBCC family protein n=1 Tax=Chitinimonas sp. TaxID=1934313 RepID=UPI002F95794E